ncbi:mitochondrial import translocase, subunit Tom22 [Piedraia hortae CBS 480.64]|uniref:Mitochondrial import translocase, subunit Tom22 n=1 Tax=Piedraia hortae CBS 480.64 TaxID=1314780 RepID=A0A6A7C6L3_9PEZI|nr:mitochondrial import translocase, subunit Tom22 [Piedraia hortae CBS 480.64]
MVQLEEVADEELTSSQPYNNRSDEDDWNTDDESVVSVSSDDSSVSSLEGETLADRIAALKDIIPPTYRKSLSNASAKASSTAKSVWSWSGNALWVVSTSALLLGVPWALAFSEEQQVIAMETEMRMQQNAQQMLTQGSGEQSAKPAL